MDACRWMGMWRWVGRMGGQIDEWMDGSLLRMYTLILVHKKIKCRKQQEKEIFMPPTLTWEETCFIQTKICFSFVVCSECLLDPHLELFPSSPLTPAPSPTRCGLNTSPCFGQKLTLQYWSTAPWSFHQPQPSNLGDLLGSLVGIQGRDATLTVWLSREGTFK